MEITYSVRKRKDLIQLLHRQQLTRERLERPFKVRRNYFRNWPHKPEHSGADNDANSAHRKSPRMQPVIYFRSGFLRGKSDCVLQDVVSLETAAVIVVNCGGRHADYRSFLPMKRLWRWRLWGSDEFWSVYKKWDGVFIFHGAVKIWMQLKGSFGFF